MLTHKQMIASIKKQKKNTKGGTLKLAGQGKKKKKRGPSKNPWIIHVKNTMAKNKGMPLQTVIGIAKKTYKKGSGVTLAGAGVTLAGAGKKKKRYRKR